MKKTKVPKMKMTTSIPQEIITPDVVETQLGTLKFFDGLPDHATVQKLYDNLDFMPASRSFSTPWRQARPWLNSEVCEASGRTIKP